MLWDIDHAVGLNDFLAPIVVESAFQDAEYSVRRRQTHRAFQRSSRQVQKPSGRR